MTNGNNLNIKNAGKLELFSRLSAPVTWAIIILWLSLTSSPPLIPGVLGWDKLLHAGAYGLLTVLVAQFLFCLPRSFRRPLWWSWLLAVCYGALLEIMQLLTQTGRTAEWWDLVADAVGAFLGCVIFRQVVGLICPAHELLDKKHG